MSPRSSGAISDPNDEHYGYNILITAYYAKTFKEAKVVSVCPGHNATNLNNYQGQGDPKEGAKIIVEVALQEKGESCQFVSRKRLLPW